MKITFKATFLAFFTVLLSLGSALYAHAACTDPTGTVANIEYFRNSGSSTALPGGIEPLQTYTTPGTYTYTVPAGITELVLQAFGAGGGYNTGGGGGGSVVERNTGSVLLVAGGGGGGGSTNESGGGGGFGQATVSVTAGEDLDIWVGGGGNCDGAGGGVSGGAFGTSGTNGGNSTYGGGGGDTSGGNGGNSTYGGGGGEESGGDGGDSTYGGGGGETGSGAVGTSTNGQDGSDAGEPNSGGGGGGGGFGDFTMLGNGGDNGGTAAGDGPGDGATTCATAGNGQVIIGTAAHPDTAPIVTYSTPGTYVYTVPYGVTSVQFEAYGGGGGRSEGGGGGGSVVERENTTIIAIGGGGGGGGDGNSGGGGGYGEATIAVTEEENFVIYVGGGGGGCVSPGGGVSGGAANSGANAGISTYGGGGGNTSGGNGGNSTYGGGGGEGSGGNGGNSTYGGGGGDAGGGSGGTSTHGQAGTNNGGGGGGGGLGDSTTTGTHGDSGGAAANSGPGDGGTSGCNAGGDGQVVVTPSGSGGLTGYYYCNDTDWIEMKYSAATVDTGLLAHWKMDESSGNLTDSTGNGHTGTVGGNVAYQPDDGQIDGSLSFDGSNNTRVTVSGRFSNPSSPAITAWFNTTAVDSWGYSQVVSIGDDFKIEIDGSGQLRGRYNQGGFSWVAVTGTQDLRNTGWHHAAWVFDPVTDIHRLYLDGVEIGQVNNTNGVAYENHGSTAIGGHTSSTDGPNFIGEMDDVRIYNHTLTAAEVLQIYRGGENWRRIGNLFDPGMGAGDPKITGLDSKNIAYFDDSNDELRTYTWDGTDWSQTGNSLSLTSPSYMTALDSDTIALYDGGLKTYDWDGTDWSQTGNTLTITGALAPALGTLDSTTIAYFDSGNDELRTYSWSSPNWSQTGNGLSINDFIGFTRLTGLDNDTIAFRLSNSDFLRTYDWDGTDWSLTGNNIDTNEGGVTAVATLNATDIFHYGANEDNLATYSWDGTDWTQIGVDVEFKQSNNPSAAALDSRTVAIADNTYGGIYVFTLDSHIGGCGNEAEMYYSSTDTTVVWCDGASLWKTGDGGSGTGGCGASGGLVAGSAGTMQYNTTDDKYYFCDNSGWVEIDN